MKTTIKIILLPYRLVIGILFTCLLLFLLVGTDITRYDTQAQISKKMVSADEITNNIKATWIWVFNFSQTGNRQTAKQI